MQLSAFHGAPSWKVTPCPKLEAQELAALLERPFSGEARQCLAVPAIPDQGLEDKIPARPRGLHIYAD